MTELSDDTASIMERPERVGVTFDEREAVSASSASNSARLRARPPVIVIICRSSMIAAGSSAARSGRSRSMMASCAPAGMAVAAIAQDRERVGVVLLLEHALQQIEIGLYRDARRERSPGTNSTRLPPTSSNCRKGFAAR